MKKIIGTLMLAGLLAFPSMAGAQPFGPEAGGPPGMGWEGPPMGPEVGGPPSPELMEKMQAMRGKMLREKLGLGEEKAAGVEAVLDRNREQHFALHQRLRENAEALERLLKEDSNDQAAYQKALTALRETGAALHKLRESEIEAAAKLLTPKEQAMLLMAIKRMHGKAGRMMPGHPEPPR